MCELHKGEEASPKSSILWRVHREQWCQRMISWRLRSGTVISASQRWIANLKGRWTRDLRAQDLSFLESEAKVTSKTKYASSLQRLSGRDQKGFLPISSLEKMALHLQSQGTEASHWRTAPSQGECRSDYRPWLRWFLLLLFLFFLNVHSCDIGLYLSYPFLFFLFFSFFFSHNLTKQLGMNYSCVSLYLLSF